MTTENYKCPGCGASLVYEEGSDSLVCPYCGTRTAIDEMRQADVKSRKDGTENQAAGAGGREDRVNAAKDRAAFEEDKTQEEDGEERQFHCTNCGAGLTTDRFTAATICPFCGSPSIIRERLSGKGKPDVLIPFSIGKDKAKEMFRQWTKSGFFTPKGFYSQSTLDSISGIYVPYWLFDFDTSVHMDAEATRVRIENKGDYEYTYTDHFFVTRDTQTAFKRIPADASDKMPDDTMERLEPFDYQELRGFELPYLSGYLAECSNHEAEQFRPRAGQRAEEFARQATRDTIEGYTTVTVHDCQVNSRCCHQEYAMLPVWVLNYRYKGKDWQLYLNGQSGRRIGSLPIDKGRVAACYGIVSAALTVLSALIWGLLL